MSTLKSFVLGQWHTGTGKPAALVDPSNEETLAQADTSGIDFGAVRDFAKNTGGASLRALSFAKRAETLRTLAKVIHTHRDALIELAMANGGNTRGDAKFDIDGASGTLAYYAELGQSLGDATWLVDGNTAALGRSSRSSGQHVMVSRRGVAVHINAFNFPAWGMCEKAAVALLAGMPVITKPATSTALVAAKIMELFVESATLPEGALQFVAGASGDLVDRLDGQDVLAFTGSSVTAAWLRARSSVVERSVHVNIEADSLNAAILGRDVQRGDETWGIFLTDVARDITQKTGQKCTAIRRVFVPRDRCDEFVEELVDRLSAARVGDPRHDGVTMGPVATASQLRDVRAGITKLSASLRAACGGPNAVEGLGAPSGKGYFVAPTVFVATDVSNAGEAHDLEVFGPVTTVIPYDSDESCVDAVARGHGSLVSTVYTEDRAVAQSLVPGIVAWNGRVGVVNSRLGASWLGPGTVLPQLLHGGPGRAGGGEELGGHRGLSLYLQRTAIHGFGPLVDHVVAGTAKLG